jgi:hypothetical protein
MRWIVTVRRDAAREEIAALIRDAGATIVEAEEVVPLDGDEVALPVEGPADLPRRLRRDHIILGVFPSSEMELYR